MIRLILHTLLLFVLTTPLVIIMKGNIERHSNINENNNVRESEAALAEDNDVESATTTSRLTHQNNATSQVGIRVSAAASSIGSASRREHHQHQHLQQQQKPPPPCPRQIQGQNDNESNLKTPQPDPPTAAATRQCSSSSLNAQEQLRAAASRIRPMSMKQNYTQYRNQANLRRAANATNQAVTNASTVNIRLRNSSTNSVNATVAKSTQTSESLTIASYPPCAPGVQETLRQSYIPSIPMPLPKVPSCCNNEMEHSNHNSSYNMNDLSERQEVKGEWKVVEVASNNAGDDGNNGRYIASSSPPCE